MEHSFQFQKSYRFEIIHGSSSSKKVLYVLHGYGQLVRYFIRKFQHLPDDLMIVAPEGMHRFYLKGSSGRVGASWMTKEARETDIHDTIHYLNKVDEIIQADYPHIEQRHLLGFSQGGATAARWAQLGNVSFDSFILWASVFPPDLPAQLKSFKKSYFVIGSEDQFFDKEQQAAVIEEYTRLGFSIEQFNGDHDIDPVIVKKILNKVDC